MRNEYIHLTNITKSSTSSELLMSPASPLRQVVYPSSKVNITSIPATTWQTQNYHMVYIWSLTQQQNCTILLELACTVRWEHTIGYAGSLIGHVTALKYNTFNAKFQVVCLRGIDVDSWSAHKTKNQCDVTMFLTLMKISFIIHSITWKE